MNMGYFRVPYILDGSWYLSWLTASVTFVLMFAYGMWYGLVYRRAGLVGTAIFGAAQVCVLALAAIIATWVAELGIGAAHDGPVPSTESLSAALRMALAPETRARAAALAGTIRTDGATVAAKLLLDAVTRRP